MEQGCREYQCHAVPEANGFPGHTRIHPLHHETDGTVQTAIRRANLTEHDLLGKDRPATAADGAAALPAPPMPGCRCEVPPGGRDAAPRRPASIYRTLEVNR